MAAPMEIPTEMGFNSKVFDLGYNQQLTPTGDSGFIQTLNRSAPTWFAEYTTPGLTDDKYTKVRPFLDKLRGAENRFLAYDPRRVMPYAYRTQSLAANPWGAPRIIAQDFAASTIGLDTMTPGAVVTSSDYISVKVGDIWYLFRAVGSATADLFGAISGLEVVPRPQIVGLTPTVIRYKKACIEMKVLGKIEEEDSVDSLPSFRFSAAQYTNRGGGS